MRRVMYRNASLVVVLALAVNAVADQTEEDPEYRKWSAWQVGSYATLRGENDYGGTLTVVTTTYRLASLTPEMAVVEVTTVTETNGQRIESPPTPMEFPARTPRLSPEEQRQLEEQMKLYSAQVRQTKGEEALTIKGRRLACEWVRSQGPGNNSKSWSCPDVPGETVRLDLDMGPLRSRVVLVDWQGRKR